jgi:hypothetical protein
MEWERGYDGDQGTGFSAHAQCLAAPAGQGVLEIGADLSPERQTKLLAQQQAQYDWYAQNGEPDRSIKRGGYQRTSDLWASLTDPDAVVGRQMLHTSADHTAA